ncbi:MAG: MFS transporter [Clostridia bacterium]|nr:MFS transporter [Clostridia bacterium]
MKNRVFKRTPRHITLGSYVSDKSTSLIVLIIICTIYSFICLTKNCFSSAMVFIVDEGVLTKSQTGTITGAFYIAYAILQLVGGALADRWHPERLLTIGFFGAGLSNLVIYFSQSYPVMLTAWTFNAMVQFAVWPSIFRIISTMLSHTHRKKGLFIVTLANPFGVAVGYLVAAVLPRWQLNFLVSALGLILSALLWQIVWSYAEKRGELKENEDDAPTVPHADEHPHFKLISALFTSGAMLLIVSSLIKTSFDLGVKSFTPTIINESYSEVSPSLATIVSLVVIGAGALGVWVARLWYPKPFSCEASAGGAMFLFSLVPATMLLFIGRLNYWIIVLAMALFVLFMSSANLYLLSYVPTHFNRWGKGGTVSGIVNFACSLGVVMANMVFTRIADAWGWGVTVKVWFLLILLGAVLCLTAVPLWRKFIKNP